MFKRVIKLFQIARKLSTSGAVETINEIHRLPTSVIFFFNIKNLILFQFYISFLEEVVQDIVSSIFRIFLPDPLHNKELYFGVPKRQTRLTSRVFASRFPSLEITFPKAV